jgi:undecaprenyl diphosphate synthase
MSPRTPTRTPAQSDAELLALVQAGTVPRHLAIIMDGNGRWAQARRLPRIAGHRAGIASAREVVELCREVGIGVLTMFAFSSENWQRPVHEVRDLMGLLEHYLREELESLKKHQIRFRAIGRVSELPASVQRWIRRVEEETRPDGRMVLNLALNYGGRAEIVDAAAALSADLAAGRVARDQLSESLFARYLTTGDLPDPDLMIRTSGECRLSNFLLWQAAYAELYFTKTLWPDFHRRELLQALVDYRHRERRFGRVEQAQRAN